MSQSIAKIKDVCEFFRGLTYSKSDEVDFSSNAVLRATNIDLDSNRLNLSEIRYIDDSVTVKADKKVKVNDILICTASGSKSHLGKVAFIEEQLDMAFGGFMGVLRAKPNINPKYLFAIFKSEIFLQHVFNTCDGANNNNLKFSQFEDLEIVLPPLPIQQNIVAKLDAIFAEIDKATAAAEANAKNAEALFQSYVTEVFESKKYDFKLVKFGTTASFVRGPFGGSLKKSIFVEKGYAVYEQQHAIYNQFSDIRYFIDKSKFEEMKRFELKSGDLIMSCSGTMGKIAIVPENIEQGVINQALLKISPNRNVMGEYIARLLSSKYFQDILSKLSGGAAIQNVPAVSVLKDITVPVPSIKNQKSIVDIIDFLESNKSIIKNSYKAKSKELASLKQSILQKAFSGELVKD